MVGDREPYVEISVGHLLGAVLLLNAEELGALTYGEDGTGLCAEEQMALPDYVALQVSEGTVKFNITNKGVYTVFYVKCSNSPAEEHIKVVTVNPFGHLPGELFMLFPVRFT